MRKDDQVHNLTQTQPLGLIRQLSPLRRTIGNISTTGGGQRRDW